MSVRAKFYVAEVSLTAGGGGKVKLQAVSRGERNADWSAATPSGTIEMHVSNVAAHRWFVDILERAASTPGRHPELFVDFAESTDGYVEDGHAFVAADVPVGDYRSGGCAECGMREADHVAPG